MREILRRAFVDNFALKLVSLILAVTLFILVHGERDAFIAAQIRVVYAMPEDRVLMTEPVDRVRVRIRGAWTKVKRFNEDDVDPIYVDLDEAVDGDFFFEEEMIRLPPGLKIVSINPPTIRLEFQKSASKDVPVSVNVEGTPDRGFRVESVTAHPATVTLRGAKNLIDATTSVETRKLSVAGRSASFTERVNLAPTELHVTVVDSPVIEVAVAIAEEQASLTLERIPVEVHPPPGGLGWVAGKGRVEPAAVRLVLRGPRRAIEQVVPAKVAASVAVHAEHVAAPGPHRVQVSVEGLPSGVAVETHPRDLTLTLDAGK